VSPVHSGKGKNVLRITALHEIRSSKNHCQDENCTEMRIKEFLNLLSATNLRETSQEPSRQMQNNVLWESRHTAYACLNWPGEKGWGLKMIYYLPPAPRRSIGSITRLIEVSNVKPIEGFSFQLWKPNVRSKKIWRYRHSSSYARLDLRTLFHKAHNKIFKMYMKCCCKYYFSMLTANFCPFFSHFLNNYFFQKR
jgi:hypothetical protein